MNEQSPEQPNPLEPNQPNSISFNTEGDVSINEADILSSEKTLSGDASGENPTPSQPPIEAKPRTVILHKILYQKPFEEAEGADNSFTYWNQSGEEPFTRKFKAVKEWKQIYSAIIGNTPCILIISNDEKFLPGYNPTAEEVAALAGKIIEIGYKMPRPIPQSETDRKRSSASARTMWDEPVQKVPTDELYVVSFGWLPPGEDLRFNPISLSNIYIRCTADSARYTLRLIPR